MVICVTLRAALPRTPSCGSPLPRPALPLPLTALTHAALRVMDRARSSHFVWQLPRGSMELVVEQEQVEDKQLLLNETWPHYCDRFDGCREVRWPWFWWLRTNGGFAG